MQINLVAQAFLPNKYKSKVVLHIDKDKSNNNVRNLKWSYKKPKVNDYTISYMHQGYFHVYFNATKKVEVLEYQPIDVNNFSVLSHETEDGKVGTDEDLLDYAKMFEIWCDELKNNEIVKIDYAQCFNDALAVTRTFNMYCKNKYKDHEVISPDEYKWFEKCANCGLQNLVQNDMTATCFSYDFKNQYGLTLNSENLIPTKQGTEMILESLPKLSNDVQHGIYHVKITCNNANFVNYSFSLQITYIWIRHYDLQ